MDTNNSLFITVTIVLISFGYLYFHIRAKSGFRYLKSTYGKNINEIYGYPSVNHFIRDLTLKIQNWMDVKDSIFIDIDGKTFPLIFGGVIYSNYHQTGRSTTNAYYLIADKKNRHVVDKYTDLFKFSETSGEFSVYWVIDIKGLIALKNSGN